MAISKTPTNTHNFNRPIFTYFKARIAFKSFLKAIGLEKNEKVLLPAYIGWSSKEGSGVFDPIQELALPYSFYPLNNRLFVDIDDFANAFKNSKIKICVIIHYFGFVDPNYEKMVDIAKSNKALVLEDEAHAMLTDLVGGNAGKLGDACIYSFHKMFPMEQGGALVLNNTRLYLKSELDYIDPLWVFPFQYDFKSLSEQRIKNSVYLQDALARFNDYITPLRPQGSHWEIPQTFPVIINKISRDDLYFSMNKAGFGVVSLYHSLIESLNNSSFTSAQEVSNTILNFPVHQDVDTASIDDMMEKLDECIKKRY
jgi:dTDP-4-amino-4,6-dideoxygalactose transaminase